jgi:hypothetical protein
MRTDLSKVGGANENLFGIGSTTRGMVRDRAAELAVINGRMAHEASKSDWEQAKRELTGGSELDPKEALLEAAPESERWDPLRGSVGHKAPTVYDDEEDDEGHSVTEKLVEGGVQQAEHEQMLQAARSEPSENEE